VRPREVARVGDQNRKNEGIKFPSYSCNDAKEAPTGKKVMKESWHQEKNSGVNLEK
jgi:hypothetical protein